MLIAALHSSPGVRCIDIKCQSGILCLRDHSVFKIKSEVTNSTMTHLLLERKKGKTPISKTKTARIFIVYCHVLPDIFHI